jgi:N-methylhydantoinase A
MGGTTADVGLVIGGSPQFRFRGEAAGQPVNLPQVDVLSVGAGGGSIARVDRFGSLRVGPESAGADPGPAAYGRGGEDATVTDAHIALGTLDPSHFLGGRMELDVAAARRAVVGSVARPLGLGLDEAAAAVLRIADATMVRALRVISVARGHDPRRFALVAFGGAGPMHACAIAEELGMRRVIVPPYPGVASALGLLASDVRYDLRRTWITPTTRVGRAELERRLRALESEARELLASAGFADGQARIGFQLDMRYRGQAYELTVPLRSSELAGAERAFHAAHRRAYGYGSPVEETEIVTLRATAVGRVRRPGRDASRAAGATSERRRSVSRTVGGRRFRVHAREELGPGACVEGPAIVEQEDSTVLVPRGWRLTAEGGGSVILER